MVPREILDDRQHAYLGGKVAKIMSKNNVQRCFLATVLTGLLLVTTGVVGASAQNLAPVQPWGLPPVPAGIGPVEKFADVSNTPQGQFLEGGAFDTQGNLWFVAIGSGWVSYLTPDAKLVPVFNCNPPAELGQTCEPQGTRWYNGKLYLTSRHRGVLVYDPQTKEVRTLVYTYRNQLFKGPNDLDFDAEGNLFFTDPWGTGPGPSASDRTGAVYQYSRDGVLRRVMDSAFRAATIAKEIKARLIGEGQSDRAAHVTAITSTIELPEDPNRHADKLNQLLSERLTAQLSSIETKARETLKMAVASATCELEPIWGRLGTEPTAYYGQLSRELDHRVQAAYCTLSSRDRANFDYDQLVLGVAASGALAQLASGHPSTIFVTVWFDVFLDRRHLDRYLATCRTLDPRLRERLMLVIAGIPKGCPLSRLLDCISRLRPMCMGVALQFETLHTPEFDLAALGSPIISVPVNDLSIEDPTHKAQLTKLVRRLHESNSHILIRQTGARDHTPQYRQLGVYLISRAVVPAPS
jgi:hypothetical protein